MFYSVYFYRTHRYTKHGIQDSCGTKDKEHGDEELLQHALRLLLSCVPHHAADDAKQRGDKHHRDASKTNHSTEHIKQRIDIAIELR